MKAEPMTRHANGGIPSSEPGCSGCKDDSDLGFEFEYAYQPIVDIRTWTIFVHAVVTQLMQVHQMGVTRACGLMGISRSLYRVDDCPKLNLLARTVLIAIVLVGLVLKRRAGPVHLRLLDGMRLDVALLMRP